MAQIGFGVGVAVSMIWLRTPAITNSVPPWQTALAIGLFLSCGTLIGAGAFNLFNQSGRGAVIGTALWGVFWLLVTAHVYPALTFWADFLVFGQRSF